MKQFLIAQNPFDDVDNLRNVVTGFIGTEEINCYDAFAVGIKALKEINDVRFNGMKQSNKNKVFSLLGVNSKIKIGDKTVAVDPLLLFQRISVMKRSDEKLESYMKFELSPYSLSLFDDVGMRKNAKTPLYSLFLPIDSNFVKETSRYTIDGGMLLYRVKWPINCSYDKIFREYTFYLKRNFRDNVVVGFDAYNEQSTIAERYRRSQKVTSKEYKFTKEMPVNTTQEKFF